MWLFLNLIIICALYRQVHSECTMDGNGVSNTNYIFTYKDSNQKYGVYRTNKVPTNQELIMLCPSYNDIKMKCTSGGNFSPPLPLTGCTSELNAEVRRIYPSNFKCKSGQVYSVGYQTNTAFLELYKTCYDQKKVQAHYTMHDVYAYKIKGVNRPEANFTIDGIISAKEAALFKRDNIYNTFNSIFSTSQTYVPPLVTVFNRGHLTPSNDYLFIDQMVNTFKYVNAVPQFGSINRSNWLKIENWVRRESQAQPNNPLRVCTGAIDVLVLEKKEIYLDYNNKKAPVPKWMFKTISDGSQRTVFLTYNNIYNSTKPQAACKKTVNCPIKLTDTAKSGFTYCCDPDDFFQHIGSDVPTQCYTNKRPRG